ncbi:MAG TPA: hypothetical protein VN513_10730 [Gemmatimonadales bacterium]|nr:hypothetical protein [Gemmatimonadales bacterium]
MRPSVTLTISSLLSIILFSFHWADEISRGMESGRMDSIGGIVILVVWLVGTVVLAERRSGYIITLLGGILGVGVLILHMQGAGLVSRRIADTPGIFFWVWTLITLGVTSALSLILSVLALWRELRAKRV